MAHGPPVRDSSRAGRRTRRSPPASRRAAPPAPPAGRGRARRSTAPRTARGTSPSQAADDASHADRRTTTVGTVESTYVLIATLIGADGERRAAATRSSRAASSVVSGLTTIPARQAIDRHDQRPGGGHPAGGERWRRRPSCRPGRRGVRTRAAPRRAGRAGRSSRASSWRRARRSSRAMHTNAISRPASSVVTSASGGLETDTTSSRDDRENSRLPPSTRSTIADHTGSSVGVSPSPWTRSVSAVRHALARQQVGFDRRQHHRHRCGRPRRRRDRRRRCAIPVAITAMPP